MTIVALIDDQTQFMFSYGIQFRWTDRPTARDSMAWQDVVQRFAAVFSPAARDAPLEAYLYGTGIDPAKRTALCAAFKHSFPKATVKAAEATEALRRHCQKNGIHDPGNNERLSMLAASHGFGWAPVSIPE